MPRCRVCLGVRASPWAPDGAGGYLECADCRAVTVVSRRLPDRREETGRYLLHRNDPDDPGYRRFLRPAAEEVIARVAPGARGLDYGCGPGPALAAMLGETGYGVSLYDPFFFPDRSSLGGKYDFVTCTETAEHFHRPAVEFRRLGRLLAPAGILVVMTGEAPRQAGEFLAWHYRADPTHVTFYRPETFRFLGRRLGLGVEAPAPGLFVMTAPGMAGRG